MDCPEAVDYANFTPQKVVSAHHVLISTLSIITNVLFLSRFDKQLFFHINCKVLIRTLLFYNLLHASLYVPMQLFHLGSIMFLNPCDIYFSNKLCFYLRIPISATLSAYTIIHVLMAVERIVANRLATNYEKRKSFWYQFVMILIVMLSTSVSYYIQSNSPREGGSLYCTTATIENASSMRNIVISLISIEVIVLLLSYGLYLCNRRLIQSGRKNFSTFSTTVNFRYQQAENRLILQLQLPLIAFQFTFQTIQCTATFLTTFGLQYYGDNWQRALMAIIYVTPYYGFLTPLLLIYILRRNRIMRRNKIRSLSALDRDEKDVYFENLTIPPCLLEEVNRLTEEDRQIIVNSFTAMELVMPDYANKVFVGLFSEYPEYKDIWPQFRAVPDSSLISCNALQRHTQVYSNGLKTIVSLMDKNEELCCTTRRIAATHRKWNVNKFHMEKMIPELVAVVRRSTGDSSPETAAAWTKLCDIIGNLINYQMTH